ncbi:hypothetical protein QBC44DRAFT_150672 [Cladorrhinum sp. PSN332]|nr:hypothetical protein QBC44DRAFT_150672 [Cladorrhinum sp. PSN332]
METTFRSSDLISRTTTGLSDLLTFKQWSERKEAAWPDPERSVGRFIKKIGKVSCWEATGPAREAFNEIAPDIKEYLDRSVEPISTWVTWSIYMFGKSPKTANPTIVFCCDIAAHRKEVKSVIAESGLLDGYLGMKTAHMPKAPDFQQLVALASGNGRISACTVEAFTSDGYATHRSGMRIFVGNSATPATVGGIIQIGDRFFYTTAGHVFNSSPGDGLHPPMEPSGSEADDDIEIDGFNASDFQEDGDMGGDFDASMIDPRLERTAGKEPTILDEPSYNRSGSGLGPPFLTSFDYPDQDYNLDYALVEITHPVHHNVNEIMHRDLLRRGSLATMNVQAFIKYNPSGEKVLALTARGVFEGRISGTPIYSRHPLGSQFLSAFKVSFLVPLEVGDCGSWIVNAATGALYGHIVAGDPRAGTAIAVPFQSIFEDIECRTRQAPRLPTARQPAERKYCAQILETPLKLSHTDPWAREMTKQYKELLRSRLGKRLSTKKPNCSDAHHSLPSYASCRVSDVLPRPPAVHEQQVHKFRALLLGVSHTPVRWEDPALMGEGLRLINLNRIYAEAEEESQALLAEAKSMGDNRAPEWSYQDCVIRSLLRWFKRSFFTWVDNPPCGTCLSPATSQGLTPPTPEELAWGARRCELYRCMDFRCRQYERFSRLNDPWNLLQTRRGRGAEWANCFGLFCRALGARTRWVWNCEDHVFLEVFSEHQRRWIHVDPANEAWDSPTLYCEGWERKLGYCIAFSVDGATDVTRRYVRKEELAGDRSRCPEPVLRHILQEITTMRRNNMPEETKAMLGKQDAEEEQELCGFIVAEIISGLIRCARLQPGVMGPPDEHLVRKHLNQQLLETSGDASGKIKIQLPRKGGDVKSKAGSEDTKKVQDHNSERTATDA